MLLVVRAPADKFSRRPIHRQLFSSSTQPLSQSAHQPLPFFPRLSPPKYAQLIHLIFIFFVLDISELFPVSLTMIALHINVSYCFPFSSLSPISPNDYHLFLEQPIQITIPFPFFFISRYIITLVKVEPK